MEVVFTNEMQNKKEDKTERERLVRIGLGKKENGDQTGSNVCVCVCGTGESVQH